VFAFGEGPVIRLQELTPELLGHGPVVELVGTKMGVESRERGRILSALDDSAGHRGNAAKNLGISRTTLWRKMRELNL